MKWGISVPKVVFLALIIIVSAAIGVVSTTGTSAQGTGTTTAKTGTSVVSSVNDLNLSLSLGSTLISPGQVVSVKISEWNTLPVENSVPSAHGWPLRSLTLGPCGTLNLPVGIEIARGFYTSSNISSAQALELGESGAYSCPAILANINSYEFEPNSDVAGFGVGCGLAVPCSTENLTEKISSTTNSTGYWMGETFSNFTSGVYTVVGGDEWGTLSILHFYVVEGNYTSVILPAGTAITVSSSVDCVAGHYSLNFSVPEQSTLAGGFSARTPGVTLYVATAQQASNTYEGHPTEWVYSTGLVGSVHFSVGLSAGSYVVWIEGADQNCGSQIVIPLEMLTQVNITQAFTLTSG